MFRKPYKVKTNTALKGSDRKNLRSIVEAAFPKLSSNDISSLISSKGEMSHTKALTHSGSVAIIYYSCSNPIFYQIEGVYYPTMYTLWKHPDLLPTVVTSQLVLERIIGGADLMAPGIIVDESNVSELEGLKEGHLCAVRIYGNKAPIAVGTALMSRDVLCQEDVKGKAVLISHSYKDMLWESGINVDAPFIAEDVVNEVADKMEDLVVDHANVCDVDDKAGDSIESIGDDNGVGKSEEETSADILESQDSSPVYNMDDILLMSFLTAIKVNAKKIQLPILTSTFYSSYVLKACPPDFSFDIKKTTYKKVSPFLKQMQKDKLIQIKELSKGVESIISINMENEVITNFRIDDTFKKHLQTEKEKIVEEEPVESVQENYKFPCVTELFVISAQVKKLFELYKMRKGDSIPSSTVKDVLKQYVKDNSLQSAENPKQVILDPVLMDCKQKRGDSRESMNWEELMDAITNNMPRAYQIAFDEKPPVVKKGKLEPIGIQVETRTGNKKVTLVNNLETYGIKPEKLTQHVQVAVAASSSITAVPGGKGKCIIIQGNQVKYLQKLFLEIYKVPRKYVRGLENIPKKK